MTIIHPRHLLRASEELRPVGFGEWMVIGFFICCAASFFYMNRCPDDNIIYGNYTNFDRAAFTIIPTFFRVTSTPFCPVGSTLETSEHTCYLTRSTKPTPSANNSCRCTKPSLEQLVSDTGQADPMTSTNVYLFVQYREPGTI